MKKICSFCSRVIEESTAPDNMVTHGVCTECYDRILVRYGFNVKKFLDQLESPVFLVDTDVRVLAANTLALELGGKQGAAVPGTFCGDVLECINASRPRGCGKTDLCPDCRFRESVNETYSTGLPVHRRVAILVKKDGDILKNIPLLVSTRKDGEVVMLRLEPEQGAGTG